MDLRYTPGVEHQIAQPEVPEWRPDWQKYKQVYPPQGQLHHGNYLGDAGVELHTVPEWAQPHAQLNA